MSNILSAYTVSTGKLMVDSGLTCEAHGYIVCADVIMNMIL